MKGRLVMWAGFGLLGWFAVYVGIVEARPGESVFLGVGAVVTLLLVLLFIGVVRWAWSRPAPEQVAEAQRQEFLGALAATRGLQVLQVARFDEAVEKPRAPGDE